jgi:hypothetical protein
MAQDKDKIILLVTEKLQILEAFIREQTFLARKYGWKMSKQDTENLKRLVDKLDDVTKRINQAIKE